MLKKERLRKIELQLERIIRPLLDNLQMARILLDEYEKEVSIRLSDPVELDRMLGVPAYWQDVPGRLEKSVSIFYSPIGRFARFVRDHPELGELKEAINNALSPRQKKLLVLPGNGVRTSDWLVFEELGFENESSPGRSMVLLESVYRIS